jgi:hypothetical protein
MEIRRPILSDATAPEIRLDLALASLTDELVNRLKAILVEHPGQSPVVLQVGTKSIRLPPGFNVDGRNGLMGDLRTLLGPRAVSS